MGCNNTKLKAKEEKVPPRGRPFICRPYGSASSQKDLFKDCVEEYDDEDDESYDSLQVYSEEVVQPFANPKEIKFCKEEIVVRVAVEKLSQVVPLPDSAFQTSENRQEKVKYADVETEKGNDDEEDDTNHPSRLVYPGSPSFRIYCQPQKNEGENEGQSNNLYNHSKEIAGKEPLKSMVHHKWLSADSVQSVASENSTHSIQSYGSIPKRRHKKKKFRPVKTLLGAKSRYQPGCGRPGSSVRNRLFVEKSENRF